MISTPLQKLPKNGEDWGELIVAKGFKRLPKVQNITQSGHTAPTPPVCCYFLAAATSHSTTLTSRE